MVGNIVVGAGIAGFLTSELRETIAKQLLVKEVDTNRYEITTPFADVNGPVVLYASLIEDNRIRITDAGYLTTAFMHDGPIDIQMNILPTNDAKSPSFEDKEFVAYCEPSEFGDALQA